MVAVRTLSGNVQKKIQFCGCSKRQFIHGLKMAAPHSPKTAGRIVVFDQKSSVKDGDNSTGTDRAAAFTDSEAKSLLHGDVMDQFNLNLDVVARHAHFRNRLF